MIIKGVTAQTVNFTIPKLKCKEEGCHHVWFARKNGEITNCPKCRSTNWNHGVKVFVTIPTVTCPNPKCKHVFSPRKENIRECRICKQQLINIGRRKK